MSDITITIPPALSPVIITLPSGAVLNPAAPVAQQPIVIQPPGTLGPPGPQGEVGVAPEFRLSGGMLETRLPGESAWTALGTVRGNDGVDGLPGMDAPQRVFIQEAQPMQTPPWVWYKPLPDGRVELYIND